MARSKRRAVRQGVALDQLVARLPRRFLEPAVGADLVGSLRSYLNDLQEWAHQEGVPADKVLDMALDIMAEIGTTPAEWYRHHAEQAQ